MDTQDTLSLVQELAAALLARGWMMTTAESCTGGLIAAACTELAGSSNWFDRGVVTYSNKAKVDLLDVPAHLIEQHGAVSESVALAMAQGALAKSQADMAVAVTGVAGPSGGSSDKPVGTVWIAWAAKDGRRYAERHLFAGGRSVVRAATVHCALQGVLNWARSA